MSILMVKSSVTLPRDDLAEAKRLGINVSALAQAALRARLREEHLEQEILGYVAAYDEWDERPWDHVAGDGLSNDAGK